MDDNVYKGKGKSLEEAILAAHSNYERNTTTVTDLFRTLVIKIGVETGGFTQEKVFYAQVQEAVYEPNE